MFRKKQYQKFKLLSDEESRFGYYSVRDTEEGSSPSEEYRIDRSSFQARANFLNEKRFSALYYTGPAPILCWALPTIIFDWAAAQLRGTAFTAARLGEVALVPHSSPISQSGLLFFNTLFDENAASHIALGQAYSTCLKDGHHLDKDALAAKGANDSLIHVDWMIGSDKLNVAGVASDGREEPLMRFGEWVS